MLNLLGIGALLAGAAAAQQAEPTEPLTLMSFRADPAMAVAAVQTMIPSAPGKAVRLTIYDNEADFLKTPYTKLQAIVNENGLAVLPLDTLEPGEYSIAAYLDKNGDGKLNRDGRFGIPKEPVAFSNGFKIKMRKPHFDETKVEVEPGAVIVITLGKQDK